MISVPDVDLLGEVRDAEPTAPDEPLDSWWHRIGLPLGSIGLALLIVILASRVTIASVTTVAENVGVPDVVIASTLVAFGTSLPELIVGIMSLRRGHPELLVGNVIGADVLNILFVIGAAAVATPLPIISDGAVPNIFLLVHLPVMLVVLLYFRVCIFVSVRDGAFQNWMGWPLLVAYVMYVAIQAILI